MKKKVIIGIISVLVVISGCLFVMFNSSNKSYEVITNEIEEKIMNTNALTMMYETEAGSGEYQVTSDTTWPQEGYVFNERLSGCENGSKLTWDDENKRVLLQTNTSDKCYVYFDKYTSIEITNVIASNITSDSVTVNVTASGGTNGIARYYYSSNNGSTWVNSTSSSYTFTNLSPGTQYTFRVYVEDTAGYESEQKTVSATTSNPTLADICAGKTFATCIKENVYTSDGVNGLYYHNGSGSYTNANQEAGDNSYRYAGANPNNYVCFGSTAATCPNDNLYRIIGVFDDDKDTNYQIKLIKADYTTSGMLGTDGRDYDGTYSSVISNYKGNMDTSTIAAYRWNYDTSVSTYGSNNWTTSEFNTINLNTNYWNYLGAIWQNLIVETTWHLGGMTSHNNTAKAFYDGERNNTGYGSNPTTYSDEIGLMYPSDYGYAASPEAWITDLYDYESSAITSNNWMYMGLYEWTITPNSSGSTYVFSVYYSGYLRNYSAFNGYAARPVFYLKSNVEFNGGTGTSSDPYRLAV